MGRNDYRRMSTTELERIWASKRDELLRIRQEIDRREGNPPVREGANNTDFTRYLTD